MTKKLIAFLLCSALLITALCGCAKKTQPAKETTSVKGQVETVQEEEPSDPHEGKAQSYLTGKWIDEKLAAKRPIAIMMSNEKPALPQYGISQADITYEAPMEGEDTRFMLLIQNYKKTKTIMPVRSCRHYFLFWALGFDAIYAHYGQAKYAKQYLEKSSVDNLSGLDGSLEGTMYHRDSSRRAPHNAYTDGDGIKKGIKIKGYETKHAADYQGSWKFNEDEENEITLDSAKDVIDAAVVVPGYWVNKPWFVYHPDKKIYARYQRGAKHKDGANDKTLSAKNIIIQVCKWSVIDQKKGYLDIVTTGSGKGYYITNGKAIPVTWKCEGRREPTKYYDGEGNEITLNQGKTWVCIIRDSYADRTTFYADKDDFDGPE